MNAPDDFEQRLRSEPLRVISPGWRSEILTAARAAAVPTRAGLSPTPAGPSTILHKLSSFLWPHPAAWAALAAVWMLVIGFSWAAREPEQQSSAREADTPSHEMRELLHEQEQMFADLLGTRILDADRPKNATPRPRSQCDAAWPNA